MDSKAWDEYVKLALKDNPIFAGLKPIVEKEILHYEILQALYNDGLLTGLVFQGGTSLRLCRDSERFSEDLDFAGGKDFSMKDLIGIEECIKKHIGDKFKLNVTSKAPKPPKENAIVQISKWEISIETAPEQSHLPKQRIKLEIANIPAHTEEPVEIKNNYPTLPLPSILINSESISEILADKLLAFPCSVSFVDESNNLKETLMRARFRDLWDINFLIRKGAKIDVGLINKKIKDYQDKEYSRRLEFVIEKLPDICHSTLFEQQMKRFLTQESHNSLFKSNRLEAFQNKLIETFSTVKYDLDNISANSNLKI